MSSSTPPKHLFDAFNELGAAVIGLIVSHRGRTVTLSGSPGQWEGITLAEPDGVEEHDVQGFGATVLETLNATVDEAELVEAQADDEDDESDEDSELAANEVQLGLTTSTSGSRAALAKRSPSSRPCTTRRARRPKPADVAPSELGTLKCPACGGDGYHKGPRLGDEPCTKCGGTGKVTQ